MSCSSPRAFGVGVTLVKEASPSGKRQRREVFVPLTYRSGDLTEVDFFESSSISTGRDARGGSF
jgi:hypothetical protein